MIYCVWQVTEYVKCAYIAFKESEYSGEFPLYIFLVKIKALNRKERQKKIWELANRELIPWEYFVAPICRNNRKLELDFIGLENSRIV